MYFSDILFKDTEDGTIEVAVLSPEKSEDREQLAQIGIEPKNGWKRGQGEGDLYDFPFTQGSLENINEGCLWGVLDAGCLGYFDASEVISSSVYPQVLIERQEWAYRQRQSTQLSDLRDQQQDAHHTEQSHPG